MSRSQVIELKFQEYNSLLTEAYDKDLLSQQELEAAFAAIKMVRDRLISGKKD